MSKLTYEDRIKIYDDRKNGVGVIALSKKQNIHKYKYYDK